MFPGAAGGGGADSRITVARGLAALSTGIRRQATDSHHQIPASPYAGGVAAQQRAASIPMQYTAMQQQQQNQQRQFASAKRSLAEMEHHSQQQQQLRSLQANALVRSVRQRVAAAASAQQMIPAQQQHQLQQRQFNYLSFQQPQAQQQQLNLYPYHQHLLQQHQPIQLLQQQQPAMQQRHLAASPLSPADSSSLCASSASGVTNPSANPASAAGNPTRNHHHHQHAQGPVTPGDEEALRRQQHLEFAKANGFFPCTATTSGGGCLDLSSLTQSGCGNGSSSVTTLQDIERCLLLDDDDVLGSDAAPAQEETDWSAAIEELLSMPEPQPASSSACASSLTVEDLLALTDPAPPSSCASVSASSCASASASVPVPPSPLQQQQPILQQQQQSKPPPSPCTPSSSTSSTLSTAQSASPAAPAVSRQQLLSDAATAIADGNIDHAASTLAELKKGMVAANIPGSDPPEQRLHRYLVDALLSRINPAGGEATAAAAWQIQSQGQPPVPELCSADHLAAVQKLHEVGVFFRLGVAAANLAMIEAARGLPKIHVVDFDVGCGFQYVALLNSLAKQQRAAILAAQQGAAAGRAPVPVPGLPALKITAVADPMNPYSANTSSPEGLRAASEAIAREAQRLGIRFEFSSVRLTAPELTRAALGCSSADNNPEAEPLMVNFGFLLSKLADESVSPSNPRDELLRRVKSLSPRLVTVVEQEMNCNTAPFLTRFREASAYYTATLEAMDAHLPSTAPPAVRALAEAALGRKAANAVAAEGWRRVERCEVLGKWRCRLGMAGFRSHPLGRCVLEPIRKVVAGLNNQQLQQQPNGSSSSTISNPVAPGVNNVNVNVSVEEEGGGFVFGWKGRRLTAVSAWRC